MLGVTGITVYFEVSSNETTVTLFAEVSHNDWFGIGFSQDSLMADSTAIVLSEEGAPAGSGLEFGVSVFNLHNNTDAGVQQLSDAEASTAGLNILAWEVGADDYAANFTVVMDRTSLDNSASLENPSHLVMASGAGHHMYAIGDHSSLVGTLELQPHWLQSCAVNGTVVDTAVLDEEEQLCIDLSTDSVCESCGRCSFKLHSNGTDFSEYPTQNDVHLPNQLVVSAEYQVSWEVFPPVPGYNVTETGERPYIHMLLQAQTDGWVGFGFIAGDGNFGMEGTDIIWGGIDEDGAVILQDSWAFTIGRPPADEDYGGVQSAYDIRGSRDHGVLSIEFQRYLDTGDDTDVVLDDNPEFPCVYAYSSGTTSFDMTRYHRYSRGFLRTQLFSTSCEPGEHLNEIDGTCTLCPPGHACPDETSIEQCPPGTYADQPGMIACVSCDNSPNVGYSNESRAVMCTDCPLHTERTIESSIYGGSRAEECVCQPGYYRPDGARGLPCQACPEGGFCAGGTDLPRARPGYWGIAEFPDTFTACTIQENGACDLSSNLTVDEWFNNLDLDTDGVLSLDEVAAVPVLVPQLAGVYDDGWALSAASGDLRNVTYHDFIVLVGVDPRDEDSFVPYNGTSPSDIHGPSFCAPGYTGEVCAMCEDGYFRFAVNCYECPADASASAALMVVGVLAVVALWYAVAQTANWLESDTFDLLLLFMQCMSIIMNFNVHFHEWISPLAPVFSLAAFNMDILNPTCLIHWDYNYSSLLQMLLPVVLLVVALIRVAVTKRLIRSGYAGRYLCCNRFMLVPSDVSKVENTNIAAVSSFVFLVYTELVLTSISPFRLIDLPDGRQVMRAAPYIESWSMTHLLAQVIPGAVGTIVYVFGVPFVAFFYTKRLKKMHLLADDDTLARFKWLYGKYHLKAFYWEIVILVRRFVLAVVATVMDTWPYTQGMVSLGFLVGLLCAQFYTLPFRDYANNITDTVFIALLIALNFAGILFEANAEFPEFIAAVFLVALGVGMVFSFSACLKEISTTIRRRRGERRLRMPDKVLRLFAQALHDVFGKLTCEELSNLAGAVANSQHSTVRSFVSAGTENDMMPVQTIVEDIEEKSDYEGLPPRQRSDVGAGVLRRSSIMKWAEKNLDYEQYKRRKSSLRMFPRMGTMQTKFQGTPGLRPLLLHDAQALIQKVSQKAWDDLLKSSLQHKDSDLAGALSRYQVCAAAIVVTPTSLVVASLTRILLPVCLSACLVCFHFTLQSKLRRSTDVEFRNYWNAPSEEEGLGVETKKAPVSSVTVCGLCLEC